VFSAKPATGAPRPLLPSPCVILHPSSFVLLKIHPSTSGFALTRSSPRAGRCYSNAPIIGGPDVFANISQFDPGNLHNADQDRWCPMSAQPKIYTSKTCAWCVGSGRRILSMGHEVSCLVCGGKGHISISHPAEKCRQCDGTGRRNLSSPCHACAGKGWAHAVSQE
jgi:hypothetical protein